MTQLFAFQWAGANLELLAHAKDMDTKLCGNNKQAHAPADIRKWGTMNEVVKSKKQAALVRARCYVSYQGWTRYSVDNILMLLATETGSVS